MEEKAIEFREKLAELCEEYGLVPVQDEFGYFNIVALDEETMLDMRTAVIDVEEE